jgi:hypothetical protein
MRACRIEKCLTVRNEASPTIECSRLGAVRECRLHAGENAKRHDAATRWRLRFVEAADQQLRGRLCGSGKLRYIGGQSPLPFRGADTPIRRGRQTPATPNAKRQTPISQGDQAAIKALRHASLSDEAAGVSDDRARLRQTENANKPFDNLSFVICHPSWLLAIDMIGTLSASFLLQPVPVAGIMEAQCRKV